MPSKTVMLRPSGSPRKYSRVCGAVHSTPRHIVELQFSCCGLAPILALGQCSELFCIAICHTSSSKPTAEPPGRLSSDGKSLRHLAAGCCEACRQACRGTARAHRIRSSSVQLPCTGHDRRLDTRANADDCVNRSARQLAAAATHFPAGISAIYSFVRTSSACWQAIQPPSRSCSSSLARSGAARPGIVCHDHFNTVPRQTPPRWAARLQLTGCIAL